MNRDPHPGLPGDQATDPGSVASVLPGTPPAGRWSRILFLGDEAARRAFAHAVLGRLAAAHPARELEIVVCAAPSRQADWAWTRWLPHLRRPGRALGTAFRGRPAFADEVRPDPLEPLIVVVLDGVSRPADDRLGSTGVRNTIVLDLDGRRRRPGRTTLRLDAGPQGVQAVWAGPDRTEHSAPLADARAAAALLAPPAPDAHSSGQRVTKALDAAGADHPAIWPPPPATPTIDHLLPPLIPTHHRGLTTATPPEGGPLLVPLGVLDRAFARLPDVLRVDLSGHLLVSGPHGSGRSTLLTTLAIALALTHTPGEAQFYGLNPDGSLGALAGLPHTGTLAADPDTTGAVLARLITLLDHRERLFAEHGLDGMPAYRARRAEFAGERYGDVFLLVDGAVPETHESVLTRIAVAGPDHGVHLAVAAGPDLPAYLRAGTGLALRLDGDAPGRGRIGDSPFEVALPRVDGIETADDLPEAVSALVQEIADHWGERPGAPGVRALPGRVPVADLPSPDGPLRVVLGVGEDDLAPVHHDFAAAPHLVVIGDAGSGRTNLLRLIGQSIATSHDPSQARILVVDYQGGLRHALPEEFVLGHAFTAGVLGELADGTARAIGERLSPEPGGRTARDWHGPRLFILIDDYERVREEGHSPLEPLLGYLPTGYELGAHLVVACSSAGAGAAMADPLLGGMHDAGAGAVLLSCPPEEGDVLEGLVPAALPPGRARYRASGETTLIQTALTG